MPAAPRFLYDTRASRAILPVELALNLLWLRIIGFFAGLRLTRTHAGRTIARYTAATNLSHDTFERIYRYTDNHPLATLKNSPIRSSSDPLPPGDESGTEVRSSARCADAVDQPAISAQMAI
jgi:hypothetical protein